MNIAFFSTKPYDRTFFEDAGAAAGLGITFLEHRLTPETARLATGHPAVCAFVNDDLSAHTIEALHDAGVRLVALRCAGFNNVDLAAAKERGIKVGRVPAYSPYAVAEHTLALMLALNRKIHRAANRVREGNFSLDGLLGFDLHGKTVGVVGTGKIGAIVVKILRGFSCEVLAHDLRPEPDCVAQGASYVSLEDLLARSHVVTLHCPLAPSTHHLIDERRLGLMRPGAMLVNTSRGALVDALAAIQALKSGQLGSLALDVYEEEADLFFRDLSGTVLQDDVFSRLLTFPNVLITGHQAFFTREALQNIADTTLENVKRFQETGVPLHEVLYEKVVR